MGITVQNIVAWIMPVVFFLASVQCVCADFEHVQSTGGRDHRPDAVAITCCGGDAKIPASTPAGEHKHQPGCRHCDSAVIGDVAGPNPAQSLHIEWPQPANGIAPQRAFVGAVTPSRSSIFQLHDLPPWVTSPTLLRLHCALII